MSLIQTILVPLDGSSTSARSLGCAAWLATRLDASLHVLYAVQPALPRPDALARLRVPEALWPRIELHQAASYPEDAVLEASRRARAGLIVMTARGEAAGEAHRPSADPRKIVGHVAQAVIEGSPVPVLLLPPQYEEALPWRRALVPLSGEPRGDEALTLAVRLANSLDLRVLVAHVADALGGQVLAAEARYADALHHEFPWRLEELVIRALPDCSPGECEVIDDVSLLRGDIAQELVKLIDRMAVDLLVIGWNGRFMAGHAVVLKHLVQVVRCPVLLVKRSREMPFRLKVGEDIV